MKTLPALVVASMVCMACGGDGDSGIVIDPPDAGQPACDPVAQTGCGEGEKCTYVYMSEEPRLGRTLCRPDGTVELGDPCLDGELGQADDCKAGGVCMNSVCTAICARQPDSCEQGERCNLFAALFDDHLDDAGTPAVGVCRPVCDPVMQTCPGEEACYLADWNGEGTCGEVPGGAEAKVQDEACLGPEPGRCYVNGCARGFDSFGVVFDAYGYGVCAQFCTPASTGVDAVNGDQLEYIQGNPNGVVCGAYDPSAGEQTECRFFNALLFSVFGQGQDTPDALGMCMSEEFRTALELGSCATHDLNAEPTQENVDNGTYVIGCESIQDILVMNAETGQWEVPAHIRRELAEIRARMDRYYGLASSGSTSTNQ